MNYSSISDIREKIDAIDTQIVKLIAERGKYVKAAATFKRDIQDVQSPCRVKEVINKVSTIAEESGLSSDIIQSVYHTMISAFINFELEEHRKQNGK